MFADFNDYVYTVQSGDTLSKIADRYGTTWQQIATTNELDDPNLIEPGQELLLEGVTGPVVPQTSKPKAIPVAKSPVLPSPLINSSQNITIFGMSFPKTLVYAIGGLTAIILLYVIFKPSKTTV
jgi:murein DD-endopeptidase MepM/ murein hydrolase activator NlpD